jgi:hypothetical protein
MTKALQLQDADGAPILSWDFGTASPAVLTAPKSIRLVNVGDEPTVNLRAWLEQGGSPTGTLRVTLAGVAITGTSETVTTALPDLAPGASHVGVAEFLAPVSGADTGRLLADTD